MLGEVVVVLDGLEGGGLAVQAEVVDGNGGGEEGLDRCLERERGGGEGISCGSSFVWR